VDYLALVDLDLTLYDYDGLRRKAMQTALAEMGMRRHRAELTALLDRLLVPYGDLLACAGLPNYRRRWNDPGLFRLCAALGVEPDPGLALRQLRETLAVTLESASARPRGGAFERLWRARRTLLQARATNGVQRLLTLTTRGGRGRVGLLAERGRRAFDRHVRSHARTYPGARAFLRTLRGQGFTVVVVSEGDEQVQTGKVRALGVHRLVDGVFITGSCCGADLILERLWSLATSRPETDGDLRPGTPLWSLASLYDRVHPLSVKSPEMYVKLLSALMRPRRTWSAAFRICGRPEAVRPAGERPGVAVVGDRYDKDLYPAMQAYGPIFTMRIARGKYGHTWSATTLAETRRPHPTAVVSDMREALRRAPAIRRETPRGMPAATPPRAGGRRSPRLRLAVEILADAFGGAGRRLAVRLGSLQEVRP